jgi:hypothetical protein
MMGVPVPRMTSWVFADCARAVAVERMSSAANLRELNFMRL